MLPLPGAEPEIYPKPESQPESETEEERSRDFGDTEFGDTLI